MTSFRILGRVTVFLAVFVTAMLVLLPFIWILTASLRTPADLAGNPMSMLPNPLTLDSYLHVWNSIPLGRQLVNTVLFAGSVAVISVILDGMAGYAFARYDFPGKNVIFVSVLFLLMVPLQITLIPLYALLSDLGWLNTYQGLIVPRAADAFGIFFFRQFFLSLPKDLEDAARIDGAGEFRIFSRVMMPLAGPAILTVFVINLIGNWNDLIWPMIILTDQDMYTLTAGLALFRGSQSIDYGVVLAGSVIAMTPMVVAFLFAQRRFIEGIATSGLK